VSQATIPQVVIAVLINSLPARTSFLTLRHWRGLWLHGKKVVLSYSVGGMLALEMPALERRQKIAAFVRNLNPTPDSSEKAFAARFRCKAHMTAAGS
jgi:hypothetical protein